MNKLLVFCLVLLSSVQVDAFDILQPLPKVVPVPAGSPLDSHTIALGKALFFDPRLSKSGDYSCNQCHQLMLGGGSGRVTGKPAPYRDAPTLWNVAFQTVYFWDGRARSLEDALQEHLRDRTVMGWNGTRGWQNRVKGFSGYRKMAKQAYGDSGDGIIYIRALASFIRTLTTPDSPFDHYIQGDKKAISKQARRGIQTFQDIGCMACHFGVNFAGPAPGPYLKMGDGFYELFPNYLGSGFERHYRLAEDLGRYTYSGLENEKHMFRLPTLRNIAITAPYFHNGSVSDLPEAVRVMARTELNRVLTEQELSDIVAFLNTLTGKIPELVLPRLPLEEN